MVLCALVQVVLLCGVFQQASASPASINFYTPIRYDPSDPSNASTSLGLACTFEKMLRALHGGGAIATCTASLTEMDMTEPGDERGFLVGTVFQVSCSTSLWFVVTSTDAQCGIPNIPNTAISAGLQCPFCGEPIALATGNKFEIEKDFSSAGSFPLGITRYYNSMVLAALPGMLGNHWRTNFDRSLTFLPIGVQPFDWDVVSNANNLCTPVATCVQQFPSPMSEMSVLKVSTPLGGLPVLSTDPTTYNVAVSTPEGNAYLFVWNGTGWVSQNAFLNATLTMSTDSSGNPTGWTYVNPNDETEVYSPLGALRSITNRSGMTQTVVATNDPINNWPMTTVTDSFYRQIRLENQQNGNLVITDANRQQWTYTFDGLKNLTSVTGPDGYVRQYLYENSSFPYALTGVIDEDNNRIDTTTYDSLGRAYNNVGADGVNATSIVYSNDYSSAQVTDVLGETDTYGLTTILGLGKGSGVTRSVDGKSSSSSTTYDANGNPQLVTDFNGNKTYYTYDLVRNLESSRIEGYQSLSTPARTISTSWHPIFRIPTEIDEPGRKTVFDYDSSGNALHKTVTDTTANTSQVWGWTYNSLGQVLSATEPRTDIGATTTYTYNAFYNLSTMTNPQGQVTHYRNYTGSGYPQTIIDPNGVTTTLTYDTRNRLLSRNVGGEVTSYVYDGAGQLTQMTRPDGNTTTYVYDAAHRLTEIDNQDGDKIQYNLDLAGNHLSEKIISVASSGSSGTVGAGQVQPTLVWQASYTPPSTVGSGQYFTLKLALNGASAPTGTVTLMDGSTVLAANIPYSADGLYSPQPQTLTTTGTHTITANFSGDAHNLPASLSATVNVTSVNQTSLQWLSSDANALPASSIVGLPITATMRILNCAIPAKGTVSLREGNTVLLANVPVNADGSFVLVIPKFSTVGTHSFVAKYSGDPRNSPSSAPASITITPKIPPVIGYLPNWSSSTTFASGAGMTIWATLDAVISACPTRACMNLQVYDGATRLQDMENVNSHYTPGASDSEYGEWWTGTVGPVVGVGTHMLTIMYPGNDSTLPGSIQIPVTVTP